MEITERSFASQQLPKGCKWYVVDYTWGKKPEAGLRIPSTNPETKFLYAKNPYIFDTFNIDGDNSASLATCRLQYGTSFYPELDYNHDFKIRILNDLINFRYRKNDYNTDVQLQLANFQELYLIIYFDLRNTKESVTGDPKKLAFHYRLNEAANAQDHTIFAVVLNEEEFVLKQIGNELSPSKKNSQLIYTQDGYNLSSI